MDIVLRILHPAVQALLLGVLATACVARRRPRLALALAVLAIGWIWIASTPVLALRLRDGLVSPLPPPAAADAIVVLGGGRLPATSWLRTGTRASKGLALWRRGYAPVVLVSGSDQAGALATGFAFYGVPWSDLRVEPASGTTHENARNSAAMLRASGFDQILLVTSPIHVRRATGAFRHEGLHVSAVAAADDDDSVLMSSPRWLPRREALTMTARCLREYLSLWLYQRRGWIDTRPH